MSGTFEQMGDRGNKDGGKQVVVHILREPPLPAQPIMNPAR